jgi:magnesium transporter
MLIDILLCSGLGGFTVLSTKAISTLLTTHPALFLHSFLPYPFLFVLVVTALGQLRYLNRALAQFDSKQVVPTQFVFFSLAVISGSGVLYRDFDDVDPWR